MSIQAWSSVHAAGWFVFPCHRVCIQPGLGKVLISDGGVSIQTSLIVQRALSSPALTFVQLSRSWQRPSACNFQNRRAAEVLTSSRVRYTSCPPRLLDTPAGSLIGCPC